MAPTAPSPSTSSGNEATASHSDQAKFRPRACARCSTSKLKCNWPAEPGTQPCERCARARTRCVLPEIKPRGPRRGQASNRVGQLEQKLDGIMSLLTTGQARQLPTPQPANSQTIPISMVTPGPSPKDQLVPLAPFESRARHETPDINSEASRTPMPPIRLSPYEVVEIIPGFNINLQEADLALHSYRTFYSPCFPFVPIANHVSAHDLYKSKPVLFRTIMHTVVPHSAALQTGMKQWFRETIADLVIVKRKFSLEYLQALLVFISWGDFHYYFQNQATGLVQLSVGLVADLGLNRQPIIANGTPYSLLNEAVESTKGLQPRPYHTSDEMRAVLGCFYMTSLISTFFRRMPDFTFTPYLNFCSDILVKNKEYTTDEYLVALVQLQSLASRISTTFPTHDLILGPPRAFNLPIDMTLSGMRKEIEGVVRGMPANIHQKALLQICYHGVVMRLYEPIIYMRASTSTDLASARRTEGLWKCLQAVLDIFTVFETMSVEDLATVPFTVSSHLAFAVVTATRLAFLEDSDWDLGLAREALDLANLAKRMENHFAAAELYEANREREAGAGGVAAAAQQQQLPRKRKYIDGERTTIGTYAEKMRWLGHWLSYKLPMQNINMVDADAMDELRGAEAAAEPDVGGLAAYPSEFDGAFWQALLNFDGSWGIPDAGPATGQV